MFHTTKYGSEELLGMKTKVSTVKGTTGGRVQTVEALADSGASASIISWDLAKKLNIVVFEKGDATLKDASHKHMDVSGKGEVMVQEEYGLPHKIKVLVSKDLGPDKLFVGLEDMKNINILHKEFPKTLPEWRREDAKQVNAQYNSIRGDQWKEQMEVKEVKEQRKEQEEYCCIWRGVMKQLTKR